MAILSGGPGGREAGGLVGPARGGPGGVYPWRSATVPLALAALVGAGLCKGVYDANIFASLFDVVRPEDRGTAAGLMNTVGWAGGFLAPTAVGMASESFGLGAAIASTAVVYALVGLLAMAAARLAEAPACDADS